MRGSYTIDVNSQKFMGFKYTLMALIDKIHTDKNYNEFIDVTCLDVGPALIEFALVECGYEALEDDNAYNVTDVWMYWAHPKKPDEHICLYFNYLTYDLHLMVSREEEE